MHTTFACRYVYDNALPFFLRYGDAHLMVSGENCNEKLSFEGEAILVTQEAAAAGKVQQNVGCYFARADPANVTLQFFDFWRTFGSNKIHTTNPHMFDQFAFK